MSDEEMRRIERSTNRILNKYRALNDPQICAARDIAFQRSIDAKYRCAVERFDCPACQAKPGEWCTPLDPGPPVKSTHLARANRVADEMWAEFMVKEDTKQ